MVQLQKDVEKFSAAGIQLVGISYDGVADLKKFSDKAKITYPLLSDKGSHTINAYGIHNQKGYAHPGTYVVDQKGTVRAALFLEGYFRRHQNSELVEAAKKIQLKTGN